MALTGQDTVGGLDHKLVRLGVDLQHLVGVSFCHGRSPPDIDCRPYCAGLRGMRQEAKKYRRAYWRGTTPAYEKAGSLVLMLGYPAPRPEQIEGQLIRGRYATESGLGG